MDVRQLRYFVEVVQAKSFTKAAERVRVAQPALGFQVRKLEDELGSALLVRHSRGVKTTEAGDALLKHAHAILRQIELAKQEVIDLAGPPRGPLALGVTPTASALLATRIVQQCGETFPGIALNLVEGLSEDVMKWLDEGRIDLGFTYNPTAVKGIESKPLLIEDLFYISPTEDEIGAEKMALAKLRNRPLILPSPAARHAYPCRAGGRTAGNRHPGLLRGRFRRHGARAGRGRYRRDDPAARRGAGCGAQRPAARGEDRPSPDLAHPPPRMVEPLRPDQCRAGGLRYNRQARRRAHPVRRRFLARALDAPPRLPNRNSSNQQGACLHEWQKRHRNGLTRSSTNSPGGCGSTTKR